MRYFLSSVDPLKIDLVFECTHYENEELRTIKMGYQINPTNNVKIDQFKGQKFNMGWFIGKNDIMHTAVSDDRISFNVLLEGTYHYSKINDDYLILPDGQKVKGVLYIREN